MEAHHIQAALTVFAEKWKPIIIYHLIHEGTLRYSELQRIIPDINKRMLTLRLKDLENDGLITRKAYAEVPPRVEYTITSYGHSLQPVLLLMNEWGENHIDPNTIEFPHEDNPGHTCSALTTIETITGKWKPTILLRLLNGTYRFTELEKSIPNINKRMLTMHLKELEEHGIISRKIFNEIPPRVEYSITPYGESLKPLLKALSVWGSKQR